MVYFINGHRGCGKSFVARQLQNQIDCNLFDTGPIIREIHNRFAKEASFAEWIQENENKYGKNFTNEIICKNMDINENELNIIIGNRSLSGIKYIIDYFNLTDYKICFIDGDVELFRNNYNLREGLNLNSEKFNQIMELENMSGVGEIKKFVLENSDKGLYFYKNSNDNFISEQILQDIKDKVKIKKLKQKEG